MNFKELLKVSGMNLKQFAAYFNIPYGTVEKWHRGQRECTPYLLELMAYKLEHETRYFPQYSEDGKLWKEYITGEDYEGFDTLEAAEAKYNEMRDWHSREMFEGRIAHHRIVKCCGDVVSIAKQ